MTTPPGAAQLMVRQADSRDLRRLQQFYAAAYPGKDRWKFPERWHWEYVDNPQRTSDTLPLWIVEDGNRIVGQTGAMAVTGLVAGMPVPAAWSVDTFVLPEYRGTGLGRKLQEANQDAHRLFLSLDMSQANAAIKQKIGGQSFRSMSLFARVSRVDAQVLLCKIELDASRRTKKTLAKTMAVSARLTRADRTAALWMSGLLRRSAKRYERRDDLRDRGLTFEEIPERFDARADTLWEKVREGFDFAVERTSSYLNWKYRDQPWAQFHAAFALRGSQPVGLVVFRTARPPEPNVGMIAELIAMGGTPEVYRKMADFAARRWSGRAWIL